MKAVILLITAALVAAWGCGNISSSVEAQNPPPFNGTFAFGNGPLVGVMTATDGSLTGTMAFGSCLAKITGTYQETGQTAFGELTATPVTATSPCPGSPVALSFFVAVSSSKAYFSFTIESTNSQFSEEGFK